MTKQCDCDYEESCHKCDLIKKPFDILNMKHPAQVLAEILIEKIRELQEKGCDDSTIVEAIITNLNYIIQPNNK